MDSISSHDERSIGRNRPRLSASPEGDDRTELQRWLGVLRERRAVVIGALALAAVGFCAWLWRTPRVYEATATVVVDAAPPRVLGQEVRDVVDVGPGHYLLMQDYIQTQRRILTSHSLARATIKRLRLDSDPAFWSGLERPLGKHGSFTADDMAGAFQRSITVEALPRTELMTVSFRHRVPAQAKRAVDGLVDAFIEHNVEQRDRTTQEASLWLADEADELRKRLSASELALYEFRRKNELLSVSLEDRINGQSQRIDKLSAALTDARLRWAARAAEAEQLAKMTAIDPGSLILPPSAPGADVLEQLKKSLFDEEAKLTDLKAKYQEVHPSVRHQEEKVAMVRRALRSEIAEQLRAARSRTDEAGAEEKQIAAQLEEAKQEGLRVARLGLDYKKLQRENEQLSRQYSLVANRTKETELSSKIKENNLHVLDYAAMPDAPRSPRRLLGALVAFVLGLVGGLLLAVLLELLDRTVKTQQDVETRLSVPLLGVVPSARRGASPIPEPHSAAAEAFRMIRTSLLFAGLGRRMKSVLITSAAAAEGKTFSAVGLAAITGQAGRRVLLVDCDLRRPRVSTTLGLKNAVGLTNVVLGAASLDDAIQPTDVPNLFVLPSGPPPPNPAELISLPRFREVLEQAGARFEHVFIDSPPAAVVTDPALLALGCDGVVAVLRAGQTPRDTFRRAARRLTQTGVPLIGAILNDARVEDAAGTYGYGYTEATGERAPRRASAATRAGRVG